MIRLSSPAAALGELRRRGAMLIGADAHASSASDLFVTELPPSVVFVLSSERHGLSRELQDLVDERVFVPGSGAVESLNVSVAAAVMLAEHARQHSAAANVTTSSGRARPSKTKPRPR